ncbi:hypothetical protein BDR07DRAFT_1379764 [Suillus spraguei]|nr:hypothetical protein BDR07DRAFT_1379764 [Suillus spraguei]
MPSEAHESVIVSLAPAFSVALHEMGHNFTEVPVQVHTNTHFVGDHVKAGPDLLIRIVSNLSYTSSEPKSVMMTEVAFTQSEAATIGRLHDYAIDGEEVQSVSCINLSEATAYACPSNTSEIAKQSRSSGYLKSYDEWTPRKTRKNAFGPVISDGHTWVDVSMVNMHMWVRTSPTTCIDVYQRKAGYAYGSIHPDYDVDDINELLGVAIKKISQKVLSCYEECLRGTKEARGSREPSSIVDGSGEEYVNDSHDEPSVSSARLFVIPPDTIVGRLK